MKSPTVVAVAWFSFVGSVVLANWLVRHFGPVRIWPSGLVAPAGVYAAGLAFLLRDVVQRLSGQCVAVSAVLVGVVVSVFVASAGLALASGSAFAASELVGLVIFWRAGGSVGGPVRVLVALVASSVAAAALDSFVFLAVAFHDLGYFEGQFVGKLSVTALALPLVFLARRQPRARPAFST